MARVGDIIMVMGKNGIPEMALVIAEPKKKAHVGYVYKILIDGKIDFVDDSKVIRKKMLEDE